MLNSLSRCCSNLSAFEAESGTEICSRIRQYRIPTVARRCIPTRSSSHKRTHSLCLDKSADATYCLLCFNRQFGVDPSSVESEDSAQIQNIELTVPRKKTKRTREGRPPNSPAGFLSYDHLTDNHDNGQVTRFCRVLSGEIGVQTGERFEIFQDRSHLDWGDAWQERIESGIENATFFFPVLTPGFFKSKECCKELRKFLAREKKLKRNDLVFPVYYITCPEMENGKSLLAKKMHSRQWLDWRKLRFEPVDSMVARKEIADRVAPICDAIDQTRGRLGL